MDEGAAAAEVERSPPQTTATLVSIPQIATNNNVAIPTVPLVTIHLGYVLIPTGPLTTTLLLADFIGPFVLPRPLTMV